MRLIDRRIVPPFGLFTLTRVERLPSSGDYPRRPADMRPIEQV
jgi:phosphatidylethanolamine/phosphatidyl-N-methylethanolamine N-methyltransferase